MTNDRSITAAVPVVEPATPTTHETENHSQQQACRVCGCTDDESCDVQGGCYWVDMDHSGDNGGPLCSACTINDYGDDPT